MSNESIYDKTQNMTTNNQQTTRRNAVNLNVFKAIHSIDTQSTNVLYAKLPENSTQQQNTIVRSQTKQQADFSETPPSIWPQILNNEKKV